MFEGELFGGLGMMVDGWLDGGQGRRDGGVGAFGGVEMVEWVRGGWVYILANRKGGALYVGVTTDLVRRAGQHREGAAGFTGRYGVRRLVWFERHEEIVEAIAREKAIKNWLRGWKVALIVEGNPDWADLYAGIL